MADLFDAVRRGDIATVEALLEKNPRAIARGDTLGMTALMWAAWRGDAPLLRLLLARGANPSVKDIRGTTALMLAAEQGRTEAARVLVPLAGEDERGEALRHAAGTGHIEVACFLLDEAGAALEYGGTDGKTPLTCAVLGGHAALAEELLRRGANLEARSSTVLPLEDRNDSGWHPLHYAADRRHPLLVQLLLTAGAQVDPQTTEGTTPLMLAARRGDEDCLHLLLRAGADPLRQNAHASSALSLARKHGKPGLLQLFGPVGEDRPGGGRN
ncbi:ankyrin repeat domain-containing protein [Archangium lipolyticum]|uniref:ankyrin repeat domain-containing protein n=1 Tax=Archangium lipolyticum TaxID=2970465 RepID=UPI00214A2C6B|nr:ankyrin repeat domain-containing protein [Archangium lipolyticum]